MEILGYLSFIESIIFFEQFYFLSRNHNITFFKYNIMFFDIHRQ